MCNKAPFTLVYCWNHIIRNVQLWCRKHGGKAVDVAFYSDDIDRLFKSTDNQQYESALAECKPGWILCFCSIT